MFSFISLRSYLWPNTALSINIVTFGSIEATAILDVHVFCISEGSEPQVSVAFASYTKEETYNLS